MEIVDAEFERRPRGEVVKEVVECEAREIPRLIPEEEIARVFRVPPELLRTSFSDAWFGAEPLRGKYRFR